MYLNARVSNNCEYVMQVGFACVSTQRKEDPTLCLYYDKISNDFVTLMPMDEAANH